MKSVDTSVSLNDLGQMAATMYGNLVKGVVDIAKGTLILDAEMHVDIEQYLLEQGSRQQDLWGINVYPDKYDTPDFIEFDSMINIRPSQNNPSRSVQDIAIQKKIIELVNEKVTK